MTYKPLPLETLSREEWNKFYKTHLDKSQLTPEDIEEIRLQFGLIPEGSGNARLNCNEFHSHRYGCLEFNNPAAGIMERVLDEYYNLLARIEKIREVTGK
jgi:hypothetical protein